MSGATITRPPAPAAEPRPRISQLITAYPYPSTIAAATLLRQAQLEARHGEDPPACPVGRHGREVLRPLAGQSYEQLYAGLWWECRYCNGSTLYPSRDHCYDHGVPYQTGAGWEKFTCAGWTAIREAEAAEFLTALRAWRERNQASSQPSRVPVDIRP